MSKLEELLQGVNVEWKSLEDISELYGGLKSKNKSDFTDGNAKYVTYKNIYNNIEVDLEALEMVKVSSNENQYEVKYGDVLFTGSSENASEAGISSAVTFNSEAKVFLNSFSFGLRFKSEIKILPEFSKYLFRSKSIRDEIIKTASGVTRYNVSKKRFVKIQIPIPPIEIQQEIVRVLDELTSLTNQLKTELETERQNRKKQFEYYRELLFIFEGQEILWKNLGDVTAKTKNIKWNDTNDIFRYIDLSSVDKEKRMIGDTTVISSKNAPSRAQKIVFEDDVIFATTRPTQMRVCLITEEFSNQIASTGFCVLRAIKDNVLPKWIFHQLTSNIFKKYLEENQAGIAYPAISDSKIKEFKIPIPSLEEQERIVKLLDQFDATHSAIEEEITKEIKLRTQQYEYYREKLLTFPEN